MAHLLDFNGQLPFVGPFVPFEAESGDPRAVEAGRLSVLPDEVRVHIQVLVGHKAEVLVCENTRGGCQRTYSHRILMSLEWSA